MGHAGSFPPAPLPRLRSLSDQNLSGDYNQHPMKSLDLADLKEFFVKQLKSRSVNLVSGSLSTQLSFNSYKF